MVFKSGYSWLPNSLLKGVDLPPLIYEPPNDEYCGYYQHGYRIVVTENEYTASTIAHELKHHIQYLKGYEIDSNFEWLGMYEESIFRYFTSYWWELEALIFEWTYARDESNDWWLRKIIMENLNCQKIET